jgi:hypothetical protein
MKGAPSSHAALASAEARAEQLPSTPAAVVLPCQPRYSLEVRVLDEAHAPLAAIPVALLDEGGRVIRSKSDSAGFVRFRGLVDQSYQYTLPSLAGESWTQMEVSPLEDPVSSGDAPWTGGGAAAAAEDTYTVQQDECVTKLADRFGLTPSVLWAANDSLARERTSMNILAPDDALVIPQRTPKLQSASVKWRYTVVRLEAMTRLRIRFLDQDGEPRPELPYLLSVERRYDRPVADIADKTTKDGFVIQRIPADTTIARITLDTSDEEWETRLLRAEHDREEYVFHVSRLDPIDVPRGVQARLNNLGYRCGDEDGEVGPDTRRAIAYFQREQRLTATGELDAETAALLVQLHRS